MDTHTDVSIDEREYSDFLSSDFLPFIAGIKEEVPTIRVNHNIVKCMDPDLPASLSDNIHRILREDLKFSGLIITDDLSMDAVKSYVENGQAVVQAVLAGNDMIITSDLKKHKDEILQAVREGKISEDIINRAVLRVIACKFAYGLL